MNGSGWVNWVGELGVRRFEIRSVIKRSLPAWLREPVRCEISTGCPSDPDRARRSRAVSEFQGGPDLPSTAIVATLTVTVTGHLGDIGMFSKIRILKSPPFIYLFILLFLTTPGCTTTENIRTVQAVKNISRESPMTVMSFNIRLGLGTANQSGDIYHLPWGRNLDAVVSAIRSVDPDIVGLQEVAGTSQIKKIARALNMNYAFEWHQTGSSRSPWWGVGILSKYPILSSNGTQISSGAGNTKHMLSVKIRVGNREIIVSSIHKDKDLRDGSSIYKILKNSGDKMMPRILIGDFNMTPSDRRLALIKSKFIDTAEAIDSPSSKEARAEGTWYFSGARIDYIFVDRINFEVLESGIVNKEHRTASDHIAYFTNLIPLY